MTPRILALCAATAVALSAQTLTTLFSFNGKDGAGPNMLVQAASGEVYGTAYGSTNGLGTVFRLSAGGKLTTLYRFCAQSGCPDGQNPGAGLIQVSNGDLYGTTSGGGAHAGGTVFRITANGTLTTLYSFCAQSGCADGALPLAGLTQGIDGNFYGTTNGGGAHTCHAGYAGCGTVFRISPSGTLTTLHSFCSVSGCTDGTQGRLDSGYRRELLRRHVRWRLPIAARAAGAGHSSKSLRPAH